MCCCACDESSATNCERVTIHHIGEGGKELCAQVYVNENSTHFLRFTPSATSTRSLLRDWRSQLLVEVAIATRCKW